MTFVDTVFAGLVAGLLVVVAAGLWATFWRDRNAPRVAITSLGNTISGVLPHEKCSRWYHAGVACLTATAAPNPVVQVKAPGRADFEDWFFAEHLSGSPQPAAIRTTPLRIPLVAGVVGANPGHVAGRPIEPNTWHLTPNGAPSVVTFTSGLNTERVFKVRVSWLRDGTRQAQAEDEFRLTFHCPGEEPTFARVERRWGWRSRVRRVAR